MREIEKDRERAGKGDGEREGMRDGERERKNDGESKRDGERKRGERDSLLTLLALPGVLVKSQD